MPLPSAGRAALHSGFQILSDSSALFASKAMAPVASMTAVSIPLGLPRPSCLTPKTIGLFDPYCFNSSRTPPPSLPWQSAVQTRLHGCFNSSRNSPALFACVGRNCSYWPRLVSIPLGLLRPLCHLDLSVVLFNKLQFQILPDSSALFAITGDFDEAIRAEFQFLSDSSALFAITGDFDEAIRAEFQFLTDAPALFAPGLAIRSRYRCCFKSSRTPPPSLPSHWMMRVQSSAASFKSSRAPHPFCLSWTFPQATSELCFNSSRTSRPFCHETRADLQSLHGLFQILSDPHPLCVIWTPRGTWDSGSFKSSRTPPPFLPGYLDYTWNDVKAFQFLSDSPALFAKLGLRWRSATATVSIPLGLPRPFRPLRSWLLIRKLAFLMPLGRDDACHHLHP